MYRFPWYLTLVSTNHASSNPGKVEKTTGPLIGDNKKQKGVINKSVMPAVFGQTFLLICD